MWPKTSRVVYIDTRWLFFKILVVILAVAAVITYWNWTRVTNIEFNSAEMEASWSISRPDTIRQFCSALNKSQTLARVKPPNNGIRVLLYSKMETREYLWDGSACLLDRKTGMIIKPDKNLEKYLLLATREIRNRSPFGEILNWSEVKELFTIGTKAQVTDINTGNRFAVCRTGGYNHADIEPLSSTDTAKLRAIYNGTINWKRRAVVVQTGGRKIAASLTGAPHGKGMVDGNDLHGKIGLYFSNEEKNSGIVLSHQMMIWKAAGRTRNYLQKMSPDEIIIAIFTAIDQQDLKSLKFMLKQPEELKRNELEHVIGVTVTGMRKQTDFVYDVTASVSLKKGPYNHKRNVRIRLTKDAPKGYYIADNKFLENILEGERPH